MARRLLGADSAATVFNIQEPEEEPATQVPQNSTVSQENKKFLSIFLFYRLSVIVLKKQVLHRTINIHKIGWL